MNIESFRKLFAKAPEKFPKGLETRYPRLLQKIVDLWDTPNEMEEYLNELVVDQRGTRQGFPQEILQEILFLAALYEKFRAERKRRADFKTLTEIGVSKIELLERSQLPMGPEMIKRLHAARLALQSDDVDAVAKNVEVFNQRDKDGMTLVMHASASGAEKSLIQILKNGGNPHMGDMAGNKAIHWAVTMGKLRATEILLFFGADPMARNNAGAYPLSLAAIKSSSGLMARLMDYGADPNTPDGKGDFPMHRAVQSAALENLKYLLYNGANRELRNRAGKTAQELTDKREIQEVFQRYHNDLILRNMSRN